MGDAPRFAAMIGELHHLPRHDEPIVRERLQAYAARREHGVGELPLLAFEPAVDLEARIVRDRDRARRELRLHGAHRLQALHKRRHRGRRDASRRALAGRRDGVGDGRQAGRQGRWHLTGHVTRQAWHARVEAVEERRVALLLQPGNRALDELVSSARGARQRQQLRHALRLVIAARAAADLGVRLAQERVVRACVDRGQLRTRGRRRLAGEPEAAGVVELLRLPGPQAFADLFGESGGIAGREKGLPRDDGGGLMVLPAA